MVNFLFYSSILITILGLSLRVHAINGGAIFMLMGFLGIATYFVAKFLKDLIKKQSNWTSGAMQVIMILMSITLFSRYLYYTFWDYPGIVIVPLFLVLIVRYLITSRPYDRKIFVSGVFFTLLTIPLFGWDFFKDPRDLIPQDWYDRYEPSEEFNVQLPWMHTTKQAEALYDSAMSLRKSDSFDEAIELYKQSLQVEFNATTLFEMSTALANNNQLEEAISILDTVAQLYPSFPGTYNNRGLIYYHMNEEEKAILDYKKAIKLEPKNHLYHSNLALAYYHTKQYDKACKEINKAIWLGSKLEQDDYFASLIKYMDCEIVEEKRKNDHPISVLQESIKHEWGTEPFPFVIDYDDTIRLADPMKVIAILNSDIFDEIAQYESLDLSYIISANNNNINMHRVGDFRIAPADTMEFEIYFDTLNINKDSLHLWQFIPTASFDRDGKFFYDTTAVYQKEVFISVD